MFYLAGMKDDAQYIQPQMEDVKFIIKHNPKLESALEWYGSQIQTADGKEAFFLPFWFEKTDIGLELHQLGNLPGWITDYIKTQRDE